MDENTHFDTPKIKLTKYLDVGLIEKRIKSVYSEFRVEVVRVRSDGNANIVRRFVGLFTVESTL